MLQYARTAICRCAAAWLLARLAGVHRPPTPIWCSAVQPSDRERPASGERREGWIKSRDGNLPDHVVVSFLNDATRLVASSHLLEVVHV